MKVRSAVTISWAADGGVCQAGHVCGDAMDLIDGRPTGSVRISFGYSSMLEDAQQFLRFVYECFLENADVTASSVAQSVTASVSGSVASSVCNSVSYDVADSISVSMSGSMAASMSNSISPVVCETATASVCNGDYHMPADKFISDAVTDDDEMCKDSAARKSSTIVTDVLQLVKIFIYPVKSCAGVEVN